MKKVFPIILSKGSDFGYIVYIPTLDINTEGNTIEDAIYMARDAIGLWGICQEDIGQKIPDITDLSPKHKKDEIVTLVDVDFDIYRRAHENRAVKKTLTIPSWLNVLAEENHINFSNVLQEALKNKLNV